MKRNGFAQIPVMIGLLIMAVAVPVATKLVQQNQDTRNQAAGCGSSGTISQCGSKGGCATGYRCLPNGCSYDPACGGFVPTSTPRPTTAPSVCNVKYENLGCNYAGNGINCANQMGQKVTSANCSVSFKCVASSSCVPAPTPLPTMPCGAPGEQCVRVSSVQFPNLKLCREWCCSKREKFDYVQERLECDSDVAPTTAPTATPTCKSNGRIVSSASECCTKYASYVGSSLTCGPMPPVTATATPTCKSNGRIVSSASECCTKYASYVGSSLTCGPMPPVTATATPTPIATQVKSCWCIQACYTGASCAMSTYMPSPYVKCPTTSFCNLVPTATPTPGRTNPPTPTSKAGSGSGCDGAIPRDLCEANKLSINAQCVNNSWDYDEQLCDQTGRKETCGGRPYCCPSAGGQWTTDLTACGGNTGQCTQCAGHPDWKVKGDADCSGTTSINDFSVWKAEYISGNFGTDTKNSWNADFNCDGKVTLNDGSIWTANFIKGLTN